VDVKYVYYCVFLMFAEAGSWISMIVLLCVVAVC